MPQPVLRPTCALVFVLLLATTLPANAQQVRQGIYRGMPVTYVVKNGKAIYQGDIVLEKVSRIDPHKPLPSLGIDYAQYLWPKVGAQYQIPYTIGAGSGNLTNLNTAITQFNATFANIQFVTRTTQTDYVNFYFDPNNNSGECEATVGRAGGQQQVGGAGGSFNPCAIGTVLHEMGHTVGLWHEQSRPDRNTYVSVNYGNLIKGSISNFNQIYDNAQTFGTLFDYASIMEYPAFSFSRNGGPAIESIPAGIPLSNFVGYSVTDIDGIERLYGSAPTSVTVTSNPPGLQVVVDGVSAPTPQVYSWPLYSTHTLNVAAGVQSQAGVIVNSTTATTFYYTYGRWNDSTAASHSITVLPGNGETSTPATSPAVTTYSANFIQLVPYAAAIYPTGTGTVTPTPAPQSYTGSSLLFYTARQPVTLTAAPNSGQNFYEFNNAPFWLPGGLGANPKTFYVPDTGLTVNTTVEFSPSPVYTVNVSPNPFSSNLYIYADTFFSEAPKNFSSFYDSTWTAGSAHSVGVDTLEYPYSSNSRYRFSIWSDGTTATTDNVTLPSASTTYTATLTPEFLVADYVNESCAGAINVSPISPTGDGFYPSGDALTFSETPNTGWLFTGWQYDLTGTSSSQPLTVSDEVLATADYNTTTTPFTLTSLSPSAAVAGSPGFTLTLNGTGFTASTVVSVNGAFPVVKFISATQVSVTVTAAQVAKPGAFQVWADSFPTGATCAAFAALPFTVANAPTLTPSPLNLSFSPQVAGTTSAAKTIAVTNNGPAQVTMNSVTATGNFAIASNQCVGTINVRGVCNITVTFNPSVAGALTGSLAISDSAPDSPQTVSLSGTGLLPYSFSPTTLAFGSVAVGTTSAAKIVALTNNDSTAQGVSLSMSGNYAISASGTTCGSSLAAGAKCNIAVTFTPTAAGAINGAVAITPGDQYSPQLAPLTGTGTGGGTAPLSFTPATLTFPAQLVGTTSASKVVTVKNVSSGTVTISSIGPGTPEFGAGGGRTTPCNPGVNLVAGATCTMAVTFTPAYGSSGAINGGIAINDNASIGTQIYNVKGTFLLPLTLAPATLTFTAQTVATTSVAQTLTITNNQPNTLSPVITGSGDFAAVPGGTTPCTGTLNPHTSCNMVVTFTPSAVGTRTAAITVTDASVLPVQTVNVTGTGQ